MKNWFKWVSYTEAISTLVLFGIAVPMKWIWDMPNAVRIPGLIHGILFIAYCILLVVISYREKWTLKLIIFGFIASLIPFGPFVFHKNYVK